MRRCRLGRPRVKVVCLRLVQVGHTEGRIGVSEVGIRSGKGHV
jgi:hypothetical protein